MPDPSLSSDHLKKTCPIGFYQVLRDVRVGPPGPKPTCPLFMYGLRSDELHVPSGSWMRMQFFRDDLCGTTTVPKTGWNLSFVALKTYVPSGTPAMLKPPPSSVVEENTRPDVSRISKNAPDNGLPK